MPTVEGIEGQRNIDEPCSSSEVSQERNSAYENWSNVYPKIHKIVGKRASSFCNHGKKVVISFPTKKPIGAKGMRLKSRNKNYEEDGHLILEIQFFEVEK